MVKKGKKKPQKGNNNQSSTSKTKKHFEIGHLVAAKVKGYPYWPARIEDIKTGKQIKYKVRFFGTDQANELPPDVIESFKDFTPKQCDLKRKNFREAFELCQEEFDSQLATKEEKHNFSPAPSLETAPSEAQSTQSGAQSAPSEPSTLPKISASPEPRVAAFPPVPPGNDSAHPVEPDSSCQSDVIIKNEQDDTKDKKQCDEPKSPVKTKSEKVSSQKSKRKVVRRSPTKLDTRTDDNNTVLPKVERDDPKSRDLTLKKLLSKIDAKRKEKARKKQEMTEKIILKFTEKLIVINKRLAKFLRASQLLIHVISESKFNSNEWELAVKEFESIFEALVKCIVFLSKKRRSDDLKACRDILTELVGNFRTAKANDKLPRSTHDNIKSCLRLMRKNSHIKDLINMHDDQFEKQENAMIERKENSVDH